MYYYPFMLTLVSCLIIGMVSGVIGTITVLNKDSLLGDTIAHSCLPGFVIGIFLTGSKDPFVLLLCGAVSATLGVLLMMALEKTTRLKKDAQLGVILSTFFGLGILISSYIQARDTADQAVIHKLLFGTASIILTADVYSVLIVAATIALLMRLFWKELVLYSFDPLFCQTIGFSNRVIKTVMMITCIATIVMGLQIMGAILMSSLLIAPAVAARLWTASINLMLKLSILIASLSCIAGAYMSLMLSAPTGPLISIMLSFVVAASLAYQSTARGFTISKEQ